MHTVSAERAAETMKKPIIVNGIETTIYKENAKKQSKTLNEKIIIGEEEFTLAKKYGLERSKRETKKGKIYLIRDIFNEDLNICTYANIVRQVSPALESITKENYLGKSKYGQQKLNNKNYLIGLYTEQLDNSKNCDIFENFEDVINIIKNKANIFITEYYIVRSVFDDTFKEIKTVKEVREISQVLFNCTKEDYLYKNSKTKQQNKGLYIHIKIDDYIENRKLD